MTPPRIEPGDMTDLAALSRWHYRAGPPATCVRILRAVDGSELAGVLVVSMPTLNARWRDIAWPELRLSALPRRRAAAILNRHVRTISRVIVDPRYRGMGVARALIGAYLDDPLTTHTESVAAMGAASPMFLRAGMRPVRLAQPPKCRQLRRDLRRAGVVPWRLVQVDLAARLWRDPRVRAPILRWASQSRATRALARDPVAASVAAASALCAPSSVFVFP